MTIVENRGSKAATWKLLIVVLPVLAHGVATQGVLGVTADGSIYLGAARTLVRHHALATEYLFSERISRRGNPTGEPVEPGELAGRPEALHPLTAWAPGYPLALAALMGTVAPSDLAAAFWLNLVALAAVVVLSGRLGRELAQAESGDFAALAVGMMPCVLALACFVGSETLFLVFMLLSLRWLARWAAEPEARARDCFLAAVAAAAATYTRYVGFTLAITLALVVAWVCARHRRGWIAVVGLGAGGLLGLLVLPLVLRNLRLTGYLSGVERLPSPRSLLDNLGDGFFSLLSLGPIPPLSQNAWLLAGSTAVFWVYVFVLVWPLGPRALGVPAERGHALSVATRGVLGLFVATYSVALVVIETRSHLDRISFRLMLPALTCLIILGVGSAARRASFARARNATLAFGGLCLTLSLLGLQIVMPSWRGWNHSAFRQTPLAQVVQREIAPDLGRGALTFFTDRPAVVYEHARGPVHWWPSPQSLPALVERAEGDTLVFLNAGGDSYFPCASYAAAYAAVLDRFASRTLKQPELRVWWVPREPALSAELARAVTDLWPQVVCAPRASRAPSL